MLVANGWSLQPGKRHARDGGRLNQRGLQDLRGLGASSSPVTRFPLSLGGPDVGTISVSSTIVGARVDLGGRCVNRLPVLKALGTHHAG